MFGFSKLKEEDLPFLNRVRNSYSEEFLHDSRKFSLNDTIEWFRKTNPEYYIFKLNNISIGYFRLSNINLANKNLLVGADIDSAYTGLGYGYAAYKEFLPMLFSMYNLNKISLEVLSTNTRAINLYKKLGFVLEGTKREEVLKNNIWIDSLVMSILKKEFKND